MKEPGYTLVNPQSGHLAFELYKFDDNTIFDQTQRNSYYSVIWIQNGRGTAKIDFVEYELKSGQMFFLAPYQPYMFEAEEACKGMAINFHPDFFCIYNHQKEVDCHGILFHNVYDPPVLRVPESYTEKFINLAEQIKTEIQNAAPAQTEILVSLTKIWLIYALRIKAVQDSIVMPEGERTKELLILQALKDAIEQYYKAKHSASDYAELLNIAPKTLGKITKEHFNKTLTNLIAERIVIEAKRELYLTQKPVKEIAYELGFEDEYYFSRFFKNHADVSPKLYRETVLPYQYSLLVQ